MLHSIRGLQLLVETFSKKTKQHNSLTANNDRLDILNRRPRLVNRILKCTRRHAYMLRKTFRKILWGTKAQFFRYFRDRHGTIMNEPFGFVNF